MKDKMNFKECISCSALYVDEQTYKYCPLCGKKLTNFIRVEGERK